MGIKSKTAGFNLAWGSSKINAVEKCDLCKNESHKLQYVTDSKKWICQSCSNRPMLEKGKMFGNLRALGKKEYDQHNDFVMNTKFGDD